MKYLFLALNSKMAGAITPKIKANIPLCGLESRYKIKVFVCKNICLPPSHKLDPLAVSIMSTVQLHKILLRGCRVVLTSSVVSENLN